MDNPTLWQAMIEAWTALIASFEPVVSQRCSELGVDMQEWGLLLAVLKFEPEPSAPADLLVRSPYTAAEVFIERLNMAVKAGLLEEATPGAYRLTDHGRAICLELIDVARQTMVKVDPLPPPDSHRLATLVDRLVQQSLNAQPPPNPWSIRLCYKLVPANQPVMPFIEQGFSCLGAYRDDAQIASWRRTGMSATALEMAALLWRGEVDSLDDICDRLAHRGHDCEVYVAVLADLRERGYIIGADQTIYVTAAGRVYCNQVEEVTEHYFFAPWSCLTVEDKDDLLDLLVRLKDGLTGEP